MSMAAAPLGGVTAAAPRSLSQVPPYPESNLGQGTVGPGLSGG